MLISYMLLFVTEVVNLTEITMCVTGKKLHSGKAPNYTKVVQDDHMFSM